MYLYVSMHRFRVWTTKGQKKLQEFLAEMGCVCVCVYVCVCVCMRT